MCRPRAPSGYDPAIFGQKVRKRAAMRYRELPDDESLQLPQYTYRQHDDGETAKNVAYAAAKDNHTEAPVTDVMGVTSVAVSVSPVLLSLVGQITRRRRGGPYPGQSTCTSPSCPCQSNLGTRDQ